MTSLDEQQPGRPAGDGNPHRDGRAAVITFVAVIVVVAAFIALTRSAVFSPNEPRPDETSALGALSDPGTTYDPGKAGEPLPSGFRQLLRRDAILPVYDPEFLPGADNKTWDAATLVIGVAIEGSAKAYPISWLNRRGMVIDRLAGIPILVTW